MMATLTINQFNQLIKIKIDQFLKNRSVESRMKYNKRRNICVALLRKTKRRYYEDLRLSDANDKKKFWKTVKPLFGNKIKCKS